MIVSLLLIFLLLPLHTKAEEAIEEQPTLTIVKRFDTNQKKISDKVIEFASWLDSFFAEDWEYEETGKNYIKLNLIQTLREKQKPLYTSSLKTKITLPNTQEKLNLLFESEAPETADTGQEESLTAAVENQDQVLGLQYIPTQNEVWRVHADTGIRFHDGIDPFARLRIRRRIPFDSWNIRLIETLFWYDSQGAGETSEMDINWPLTNKLLFRSNTYATWKKDTEYFDLGQNFYLFHNISKIRVFSYQAGVTGISEPNTDATNYVLSLRMRQRIHKDWLYFEINPRIDYPEETNYRPDRSLSFRLEIIFGAT